jgi:AraC-like DNA-binding protein
MMHRSPKTLAHIFAQAGNRTPLQLIHYRIMLEARQLLRHSDKPVKEIAYELGYEDIQSFSRFFRSKEGVAPVSFRQQS